MEFADILGLVAGAVTTSSFLPQLILIVKTKSAKDISFGMFFIFCLGILLWLAYGIVTRSFPVIIANVVSFVFSVIILFFKVRYG